MITKTNLAKFIGSILAVAITLASLASIIVPTAANAVSQQPQVQAFYQDSLATKLTPAGTSMTLVRGTDAQGRVLSGYYGFVIDEGTASQETVIGTASGTAVSNLIRGVDVSNATSSVPGNIQTHARGASVKITTWPSLGILNEQLSGTEGISNPIYYDAGVATSTVAANRANLASVGLLQDTAFNGAGVINAATTNKGVVQIATPTQVSSSTSNGSTGAILVIPASSASSSPNGIANIIPTTGASGKLATGFIDTTGLFATSTLYATPVGYIGKNLFVDSTIGTTTFNVPANVSTLQVELVGGGGGSAGCSDGGSTTGAYGGSGGAGGYALKYVNVLGMSTTSIFVGPGGSAGTQSVNGGTASSTSFGSFFSATGGAGGVVGGAGGLGGIGTSGDLNTRGGGGAAGRSANSSAPAGGSGPGGSSFFGGGAPGATGPSGGTAGGNYGGGASGGACSGNSDVEQGASGGQGVAIIRW